MLCAADGWQWSGQKRQKPCRQSGHVCFRTAAALCGSLQRLNLMTTSSFSHVATLLQRR